jgi:phenylalanine ammonia-lyase
MALASARYARESIDLARQARFHTWAMISILTFLQLIATHILTACQALDIREMNARFLAQLEELFSSSLGSVLSVPDVASWVTIKSSLFKTIRVQFGLTTSLESSTRFQTMLTPLISEIYALVHTSGVAKLVPGDETVTAWVGKLAEQARELFTRERLAYFTEGGSAYDSLSNSSKVIYGFVRKDLGVSGIHLALFNLNSSLFPRSR